MTVQPECLYAVETLAFSPGNSTKKVKFLRILLILEKWQQMDSSFYEIKPRAVLSVEKISTEVKKYEWLGVY